MARTRNRRPTSHTAFESLENRLLFVTYQVDGTSAADTISISISGNSIISVVNGVSDSASDIINNNIEINGLGGNDTISIIETGANTVVVNAGSGNDTINIGNGGNDLDNIDDVITVNGDTNTDTVVLFDQNNTTVGDFRLASGNQYSRGSVPAVAANVEIVTINASSSIEQAMLIDDPPSADVTINGSATQFNFVILTDFPGTRSGIYRPDGAVTDKGSVTFSTATINFTQCDQVAYDHFSAVTLITPNANDSVTLSGGSDTVVSGSSGGLSWPPMNVESSASTLTLDLATHDAGAGNDTITGSGGHNGATTLLVNAGTGTNSLTANGGNWNVSTAVGIGGVNLDVIVSTANFTFSGFQNLKRLEINNNGNVDFTGTSNMLNVSRLAVVSGNGNLTMGTGQFGSVLTTGSFSIGAGRTLVKKGGGTLTNAATQSNGAGSVVEVQNGTMNFNTDCGSAALRTLQVNGTGGITNFNVTQHLAGLFAGPGIVNVGANGNRVLVTDFVGVNNEGGGLNLNDNDMILNYTNVADDANARALLHSGRAGGAWNGFGIVSNTAAAAVPKITTLGAMEATEFKSFYGAAATFDGQTVDNTALLIKYTWYGDTDFNGKVDGADYARIDATFNQQATQGNIGGWTNGDFDDNGKIDGGDYALIDAAFNAQSGVLRPAADVGRQVGLRNLQLN